MTFLLTKSCEMRLYELKLSCDVFHVIPALLDQAMLVIPSIKNFASKTLKNNIHDVLSLKILILKPIILPI